MITLDGEEHGVSHIRDMAVIGYEGMGCNYMVFPTYGTWQLLDMTGWADITCLPKLMCFNLEGG